MSATDAALERGDLDLAAHVGRDVDGEPGGEGGGVAAARVTRIGGFHPALRIGGACSESTFLGSLCHGAILPTSAQSSVISRAAGLRSLISETRRPERHVGEGNALADGAGESGGDRRAFRPSRAR